MTPGTSEATEAQGSGFMLQACLPSGRQELQRASHGRRSGARNVCGLSLFWWRRTSCGCRSRLLHTWMFVGCFSAAPLHPRARRMVAVTSPGPTASLPFTRLPHQRVDENHYFHFLCHRDGLNAAFLVPFLLKKGQRCVQLAACWSP